MRHLIRVVAASVLLLAQSALAVRAQVNAPAPHAMQGGMAACLVCHSNSGFGVVHADVGWRSLFVDPKTYAASVHGKQECTGCHRDMAEGVHRPGAVEDPAMRAAIETLQQVPSNAPTALAACVVCHKREFEEYRHSIHGRASLAGNQDAPSCTDCHGYHYIERVGNLESSVFPSNVLATCAHCHADSTVMAKYDVARNVAETYEESFHGTRARLGSLRVAVCTSCHGVHDILAPSDPMSKLYPDRRAEACGECHEGASHEFAMSFTHRPATRAASPLVYWIRVAYMWVIYLTIGAMGAYVLLDVLRWLITLVRGRPRAADAAGGGEAEEAIQRWNAHQVIQHLLLMASFTTLVFTGLPLRVPNAAASRLAVALVGGTDNAGVVHRVAAVVLMLTAAYHIAYLCQRLVRRQLRTDMLPRLQDVRDVVTMIGYFFGLARERARFGRYSFAEKFEYWAVAWGSAVMVATGFILWLPGAATRLLPAVGLDIARVIHGYEAILAALAIIVWHFYHVHLHPAAFPMSWTWVTGKMPAHEMRELHPLEYERVMAEGAGGADDGRAAE